MLWLHAPQGIVFILRRVQSLVEIGRNKHPLTFGPFLLCVYGRLRVLREWREVGWNEHCLSIKHSANSEFVLINNCPISDGVEIVYNVSDAC